MEAIPLELKQANAFVSKHHRHHPPVHRDKFRIGCTHDGKLVGIVQLARPVARMLDDGNTIEVVRLCTDGTENACSFLYAKAARIAKEMGYKRIITYISESEGGISLMAAGWNKESNVRKQSWDRPSRPRATLSPMENKQRWSKILNHRNNRHKLRKRIKN